MITIPIDPILFSIGHFHLRWYCLIVTAVVILGVYYTPTPVYEILMNLAIFALLWNLSHPTKSQKVAHYLLASIFLGFGVYFLVQGILTILTTV